MISSIIFSKNRACQLHLLLESVEENYPVFDTNVFYDYSNEKFENGYELIKERFSSKEINWKKEENFQEDLINLIESCEELICFFTDDDILYRNPTIPPKRIESLFTEVEDICCLSFRLGQNTTIQDQYTEQKAYTPQDCFSNQEFILWNWKHSPGFVSNFYYPFSVDGHIYRKKDVKKLLTMFSFDNPNNMEGGAVSYTSCLPDLMSCMGQSCVVNTPINIAGSSRNRAGEKFGLSIEELNNKYVQGQTIDIKSINFSNVIGCHQELEMEIN